MMQERRRIHRRYLAIYSRVFDHNSGCLLGYLGDLSTKGTMIISDGLLMENERYILRFDLPEGHPFSAKYLLVEARVAWCQMDVDSLFYSIGFEFIQTDEKQNIVIDEMIEAYEFNWNVPSDGHSR